MIESEPIRMDRLKIEVVAEYRECRGMPFSQPNGVAVFASGAIIVADGANNRICVLDETGGEAQYGGREGFAQDRFKEPVGVFVSPVQHAYVADWHNHRVVVFDENLNYIGEVGRYGKVAKGGEGAWDKLWRIASFVYSLTWSGTYVDRHFVGNKRETGTKRRRSVKLLAEGLSYWVKLNGSLLAAGRRAISAEGMLDKPNGVAFLQDRLIVISQKNARCLSLFRTGEGVAKFSAVRNVFGPTAERRFGRLGNVVLAKDGLLYVCDERQHCIWKFDTELRFQGALELGVDSGTGEFLPFSCASLTKELLVVCGGLNFQIIDLGAEAVVFCSENLGELHGVAYDERRHRLYVADRSGGVIRAYEATMVAD
jgi:DNA-binding beta-propeller fold protein YncE